jgi:outer membrane protein assembly factor BamB
MSDFLYRTANRLALVASIGVVVVCALMLYDAYRREWKDPLEAATIRTLKVALAKQPDSQELKDEIRAADLRLRSEYFRQRTFAARGAMLLAGCIVVFLLAAKTAATMRRKLPQLVALSSGDDRQLRSARAARWAVGALASVLMIATVAVSFGVRSPLSDDVNGVVTSQTATSSTVPPPVPAAAAAYQPSETEIRAAWPRFRGADGSGISAFDNVPETWDGLSGKNILWKTAVPLPGNGSVVVCGRRAFVSGADEKHRRVFCFDTADGKLLWQGDVPGTPASTAKPPQIQETTGYAAPTPATDGRHVFAIFANGDVAAFDYQGRLAWPRSLGLPENPYGHAVSLLTYQNLLLVLWDQSEKPGKSKLLALDGATGRTVWEQPRPVRCSWSTPIVARCGGRQQLIANGNPWVISYDPASGKEIWRAKCFPKGEIEVAPSPVVADGTLYVAGNDQAPFFAVATDGTGDVTESRIRWKWEDYVPDTCSPLATADFVFSLNSEGTLTCYDPKSGQQLWQEDFQKQCKSSPAMAHGRLYVTCDEGTTWIVAPGREGCKRLSVGQLGEKCFASPAFQDGRIYLRGVRNLYCIGAKAQERGGKR